MIIKDINEFSDLRYKIRAYVCYLFSRNIPNYLPGVNADLIKEGFEKIAHEIENFEAFYILDANGVQIEDNISLIDENIVGKGENRSNKAYYYRTVKEHRCTLSDPYPSSLTNELCITASYPVYNDKKELQFVACIDIKLEDALKIVRLSKFDGLFSSVFRGTYTLISLALFVVAAVLFAIGIKSLLFKNFSSLHVEDMFSSTIILTLSLAIIDLVKAIVEVEVLGHGGNRSSADKTMMRFVVSIIIALAIEALMLVFKFAITAPDHILYAVYLICGVALLICALGIYTYIIKKVNVDWDN